MSRAASRGASARHTVPAVSPWHRVDAVKAAALIAIGAILWAIGWYQVSDRAAMDDQIAPMNLAVIGVLIIGAGQASWFLTGRRAVGARRRALLGSQAKPPRVALPVEDDRFAGRERFYHRLDCALVADRGWVPTSRSAQEAAGRVRCGVCVP